MNKFIFVLLLVYNFSYSKKIEGYYITTNNEKYNTVFEIPVGMLSDEINFEAIQFVLKYYDENEKKQKLDLELIFEVGFDYNGEKFVLRKLRNSINLVPNALFDTSYILLRIIKEDIISSYSFSGTSYMVNSNGYGGVGGGGNFYKYGSSILVKKDGTMVDPSTGSFRKKMSEFFSDCPDLVDKINDKVYKRNQIDEVIEYYKVNC
jgi:hypothetical protein